MRGEVVMYREGQRRLSSKLHLYIYVTFRQLVQLAMNRNDVRQKDSSEIGGFCGFEGWTEGSCDDYNNRQT